MYKVSAKKTVEELCLMIPKSHSVHPLPPQGRLSLQPNFRIGGDGLHGTSAFRGGLLRKRGINFFKRGCNLYIKNKLKSEMFNDKKSLKPKIFFSVIIKNSKWEILSKNLVTFKR